MSSLNKVMWIGNLGRDPEVRYLESGVAVCNISVAATESWKDKQSGERQERTEWLRCNLFDKLAELAGEYLRKGSKVYLEGKLQTRQYEKEGVTHYATECRVEKLVFLSTRGEEEGGGAPAPAPRQQQRSAPPAQRQQQPKGRGGFDDMDDDIPF